jgi:Ca2+-binding EF-hand superfamily protein
MLASSFGHSGETILTPRRRVVMSSVSSTSNSNAAYYAMQKKLFDKLDSDENGNLDEKEFLAGKPKGMTKDKASEIYDSLDANQSGRITMDEFASGTQSAAGIGLLNQFSSDALDVLLQLQQQGGMMSHAAGADTETDAAYDALDINKDGVVSQEEFLAAHPEQASDAEARELFGNADTDKSGEDELSSHTDPSYRGNAVYSNALGLFDLLDVNTNADDATTTSNA